MLWFIQKYFANENFKDTICLLYTREYWWWMYFSIVVVEAPSLLFKFPQMLLYDMSFLSFASLV